MSNGAVITFNDPRRFGSMKLVPRARLDEEPLLRSLGPGRSAMHSTPPCSRTPAAGKKTSLKLRSPTSASSRASQYLRLRSAAPCALVAQAPRVHARDPRRRLHTSVRSGWSPGIKQVPQRRDQGWRLIAAGSPDVPMGSSACSSTTSASTTARQAVRDAGLHGTVRRIVQTGRSTFFSPVCQK